MSPPSSGFPLSRLPAHPARRLRVASRGSRADHGRLGQVQKAKAIKGAETRAANAILEKLSRQEKAKQPSAFAETLKVEYGKAGPKIQAVVKETVAGNLKS